MIVVNESSPGNDFDIEIVLIPHRAMEWRDNKRVILVLGSVCVAIALGYGIVLGTWIILPFAGLEVIALTAGLYYASWKLNYRHIIRITQSVVVIEKGVYKPRKRWQLKRSDTYLHVSTPKHEWEAKKLTLKTRNDEVDVGEFLNKTDAEKAIDLLHAWLGVSA